MTDDTRPSRECALCGIVFYKEKHESDQQWRLYRRFCSRSCYDCRKKRKSPPTIPWRERFDRHVMPEPNSGCYLWTATTNEKGYGRFNMDGRLESAHRVAWAAAFGPIPEGMQVLHKCDIPCCVNPAHLFLGTNDDNLADKIAKGRQARLAGESNPKAKLTEEQVGLIRADPRRVSEIAREFGVSLPTIARIKDGSGWRRSA